MNPLTATLIGHGLEFLLKQWATLENKPAGWVPSREDWDALDHDVAAATPEARYLLAVARAKLFQPPTGQPTATRE